MLGYARATSSSSRQSEETHEQKNGPKTSVCYSSNTLSFFNYRMKSSRHHSSIREGQKCGAAAENGRKNVTLSQLLVGRWIILLAHLCTVLEAGNVTQIHLAVCGENSRDIRIQWRIDDGSAYVQVSPESLEQHSMVWPSRIIDEVDGRIWKNGVQVRTCQYWTDGVYGSAVFNELSPKTKYLYRFIDDKQKVARQGHFVSPPDVQNLE